MLEVEVTRPKQFADKIRDYQLWVDGEKIADIKPRSTQVLTLPEGSEKLKATIDWCSSSEFLVNDIKEGRIIVKNAFADNFFKATFMPLYYITLGRNKYLTIESELDQQ